MHMVRVACTCICLFYILVQCKITVTARFSLQFQAKTLTRQLRNQANFQQAIFLGDFWPDFGGLTSCPDKLRESPKACRKIRTNLGKFGDLFPDKSVQPLGNPGSCAPARSALPEPGSAKLWIRFGCFRRDTVKAEKKTDWLRSTGQLRRRRSPRTGS